MKRIKIAQIGTRHDHAGLVFRSLRRLDKIYEVVAYADPEPEYEYIDQETGHRIVAGIEMRENQRFLDDDAYSDIPVMNVEDIFEIPDLDAVTIETSEKNLTKYAKLASMHGLNVHMDKPGGCDIYEFEDMIETFRTNKQVFHIGYMYRYNPSVIKLMKDIEEGKLGQIYSVECHMDCCHTDYKRKWLGNYKGGMMFFLGCHLIDIIYRIQGEPIEVIPMNCSTNIRGIETQDYGFVALKYTNGVSFAKTCASEPGGFMRRQLVVCGEKGTVQLMPFEWHANENRPSELCTTVRVVDKDLYNWSNDGNRYDTEPYDRYDYMLSRFAEYINNTKHNPYTLDYELNLYKLLMKCCGEKIDL